MWEKNASKSLVSDLQLRFVEAVQAAGVSYCVQHSQRMEKYAFHVDLYLWGPSENHVMSGLV